MTRKRIQVNLTEAEERRLKLLVTKFGLNQSSGMRYCLNKIADQEGIPQNPELPSPAPRRRK